MKPSFFLLIALAFCTSSYGDDMTLSSESASYNGKNLILEGSVELNHGLGLLLSGEAFLEKERDEGDLPFSIIELKEEVKISLKNQAHLLCDKARLDFLSLTGDLQGKGEVVYQDEIKDKKGNTTLLKMVSNSAHLTLLKEDANSFDYDIKKLTAHDSVHVTYGSDLLLEADEALYDHEGQKILAYPKRAASLAMLRLGKNNVSSSFISLELDKSTLSLETPKGEVASSFFSDDLSGPLLFSANTLEWDQENHTLTLQGSIEVVESHLGQLFAQEELVLVQEEGSSGLVAKTLYVKGPSRLIHESSTLTCPRLLHVSETKGRITAAGSDEEQVTYENGLMHIKADQAFLEYAEPSHTLSSVLLKTRVSFSLEANRFALADRLSYSPYTKTVILYANPGSKVLFCDEEQEMTMSADEVHITRHEDTGKPEVKGVGRVKLQLSQEETTLLQKTFANYKESSHGND